MNLDSPASLEGCWLDIFRELGEPEALLACTFTLHADFFADLLTRFAEACCEGGASNGRPFTQIPIDIVCDRSGVALILDIDSQAARTGLRSGRSVRAIAGPHRSLRARARSCTMC